MTNCCERLGFLSYTQLFLAFVVSSDLFAGPGIAKDVAAEGADGSSVLNALMAGLALLLLAVLTVGALTLWGRQQDRISIMMSLSMRSLIDSKSEAEGSIAAKALAQAKDAGALLVLFDVFSDDKVGEHLRKTAGNALDQMSMSSRKYKEPIKALIAAVEEDDHQKVIDILMRNFEGTNKVYVQTAFIIGREFLMLGKYVEARDWLHTAVYRNRQKPLYGSQLKRLIDTCNERMFKQGDSSFQESDLHEAKKCFSEASYGLDEAGKKRFAPYLRLACVYCKLGEYEDAAQSVSLALKNQQEPETSRALSELLNNLLDPEQEAPKGAEKGNNIRSEIDKVAIGTISRLAKNAAAN